MLANQFEHLRIQEFAEDTDINIQYETIPVYMSRDEYIAIYVAECDKGKFALGHKILFSDGREAQRFPSLEYGYFSTRVNAVLYMLGYIRKYCSYFSTDVLAAVDRMIRSYQQPSIYSSVK